MIQRMIFKLKRILSDQNRYGVSVTTLEEVFLKVGQINDREELEKSGALVEMGELQKSLSIRSNAVTESKSLIGLEVSNRRTMKALFLKRIRIGMRDLKGFTCQLIIPCIILLIGVQLLQVIPNLDTPE